MHALEILLQVLIDNNNYNDAVGIECNENDYHRMKKSRKNLKFGFTKINL